jgi:hypothetical protein
MRTDHLLPSAAQELNRFTMGDIQLSSERQYLLERIVALSPALEDEARATFQFIETELQLGRGTYFTPLEKVWVPASAAYDGEALSMLRRTCLPDLHRYYSLTRDLAANKAGVAADAATPSSLSSATKWRMWTTDVFGDNAFHVDVGRLVPADADHASVYFKVAQCVLGMHDDLAPGTRARMKTLQKAIHGTLGGADKGGIEFTGMKHFPTNKIRLAYHRLYFEEMPCVIMVPIITLQQMREWHGRGYRAIVLAGGHKGPTASEDITAAHVYKAINAGFLPPEMELRDVLARPMTWKWHALCWRLWCEDWRMLCTTLKVDWRQTSVLNRKRFSLTCAETLYPVSQTVYAFRPIHYLMEHLHGFEW